MPNDLFEGAVSITGCVALSSESLIGSDIEGSGSGII
jgi:hypothetical protein